MVRLDLSCPTSSGASGQHLPERSDGPESSHHDVLLLAGRRRQRVRTSPVSQSTSPQTATTSSSRPGSRTIPSGDPAARGRLPLSETHNGVKIRRRWHYVPRLQTAAHRAAYESSLLAFGLTAFPPRWKADVIVGTCPTIATGVLAATASRIYRAPYGLVFQDLVGLAAEQSGVTGGARVARFVQRTELGLAERAAAVGIIAEGFRPYFVEDGVPPSKVVRLRNWTRRVEPTESAEETRKRFGWDPDDFVCVHGGNMGHKQGLDNLLDAAAAHERRAGPNRPRRRRERARATRATRS